MNIFVGNWRKAQKTLYVSNQYKKNRTKSGLYKVG